MVITATTFDETVICGLHNLSAPARTNGHVHECMHAFLNDPNFSFWAAASAGRRACASSMVARCREGPSRLLGIYPARPHYCSL